MPLLGSLIRKAYELRQFPLDIRNIDPVWEQEKVLKKLLDNADININSDRWSRINKCTKMTATRDINDLIEKGIFIKSESGGRSTYYQINWHE
jgi:Fic family protein